ncbi:16370_t:CDS:1, partial [Gigaspora rosea]
QNEKDLWQKKIEVIKEAMRKVDKINQSTTKNKLSSKSRKQLVNFSCQKVGMHLIFNRNKSRNFKTKQYHSTLD